MKFSNAIHRSSQLNIPRNRNMKLRKRQRASTFLELLISALILSGCCVVIVLLWSFNYSYTQQAADMSCGYNLARQQMEVIKETGFYNTTEYTLASPQVHYYDQNMSNVDSTPSLAKYKMTTSVVSDATKAGVTPTAPADTALRTVTITVTIYPATNPITTLAVMSTYLSRAGI